MDKYSNYWDKKLPDNLKKSTYSEWLNDFKNELDNAQLPILDLGCGNGEDTNWLANNGYCVISTDFAPSAVEHVKKTNKNTYILDMRYQSDWQQLKDNSISIIVANLSLHYFDNTTTKMIMHEIKRVLVTNGLLIARVNSNLDTEFGAGEGIEIEPNFYQNLERGINKRFFTQESIINYFSLIGSPKIDEKTINYLGKNKQIFQIIVKNNKKA